MTIKDIAKQCGVSISTVSRVLNKRPDVSPSVRERVFAVVESCGYIPNDSARDLVRSHSDAIGVITRGTGNPFFSEVLKAISREIDRAGYTMVLRQITTDADEVMTGAMLEREKKLQGLIFLGGRFDYTPDVMNRIVVPYVCCSYSSVFGSLDPASYASIAIDDHDTACRAVSHLISLGHRNIAALISSPEDRSISELRYRGYLDALSASGIPFAPELLACTNGRFDLESAYAAATALIDSGADFSAIFALSDIFGIAAMKALHDRGRRVPEDCSVIAIDGLDVSAYTIPTLTTLIQPAATMGQESVALLLDMLENGSPARHLRPEAILREGSSVQCIPENLHDPVLHPDGVEKSFQSRSV